MTITTKHMPATETKGSRVKAKIQGKTLVVSWRWELSPYENHLEAAKLVSGLTDLEEVRSVHRGFEFRKTDHETCLGYKNFETAQVILQISNERPLYDLAVEWVKSKSGSVVPWCSLVEHLTKLDWKSGFRKKVTGLNLTWDSPLICRKEVLDHVRDLIVD